MTETLRRIVLAERPKGDPAPEHFRLETAGLPAPGPGQMLLRTIWLSLDPYMRGRMDAGPSYADPVGIGETMTGQVVAEVIESRLPAYRPGDIVVAPIGWASHGLSDGQGVFRVDRSLAPLSTALGVLGMPGLTAWVGLNDIAGAKAGETIVVSAATGAVGSLVCQLARRKGMRVIGIAGGADKCRLAVEELGCDHCLDHRAFEDGRSLGKQLREVIPDGTHVYFENVGGKVLEAILPNMRVHGRIALCGMIAWYSGISDATHAAAVWRTILVRRLRVQGFIIFDHYERAPAFFSEVAPLVRDGAIRWRETVAEGLENAPRAFLAMLKGGNTGKQLVRVGAEPA